MKKTKGFWLISLAVLLMVTGCGLIPVQKQGLMDGEKLAVDIEKKITFYEEVMLITDAETNKKMYDVDFSSPFRNDEISRVVVKIFEERFPEALRERGVIVTTGAPVKIKITMAYGKTGVFMVLMGHVTVKRGDLIFETKDGWAYADPAGPLFSPNGWRNLRVARTTAEIVTDRMANALVILLREKGELKK
ncbi:hypothetical protein KKF25_03320 [Patescibacteria group bacterium]|nr:hypothetical protein [Patescibacteria group bacterium]